jgi:hypothetical protein
MTNFRTDIKLGTKYRDDQTGIEGIATSIHFYQYACERVTIEFIKNDGELQEVTFDAPRLRSLESGLLAKVAKTGGPARAGETRKVASR